MAGLVQGQNGAVTVRTPEDMFDAFVNGRLALDEWTHEAHLITAVVALRDRTPHETLDFLRDAIQTHNCGIGIRNTDTEGYHETITRYYVTAVAHALDEEPTIDHVMAAPTCSGAAPLEHWSRDLLFSTEARRGWVAPDIKATPWPIVGTT